jgi:replication-associated recombination protein RarA
VTGKPRNSSLFEEAEADTTAATSSSPVTAMRKDAPLAERMRPRTIDEILGQEALLGPGEPLHERSKAAISSR